MSTSTSSCECSYPKCECQSQENKCLFSFGGGGFGGAFSDHASGGRGGIPLPSVCISSHPVLTSYSCKTGQQNKSFGLGFNHLSSLEPYVASGCGCEVHVVIPACEVLTFTYNDDTGVYEQRGRGKSGDNYGLVYRNNGFTLVNDNSGERWNFRGFEPGEQNPGRFISGPAPNGSRNSIEAFDPDDPSGNPYTADNRLKGLRVVETVDSVEITYAYVFDYNADGNMTVATAKKKEGSGAWQNLARALFTYYSGSGSSSNSSGGGGEQFGSEGDLESITEQVYDNSQWTGDRVTYYRYYQSGDIKGDAHQLKYVLGPEAYERLSDDAQVSDPFTASNTKVAEYADTYFQYDINGEVSLRKEAGSLATTFVSETSDYDGTSHNSWKYKSVETRGDGGVRTQYQNYLGQSLLEEFKESASATEKTFEFREYDSSGNLTLHATSSALEDYSIVPDRIAVVLVAELRLYRFWG